MFGAADKSPRCGPPGVEFTVSVLSFRLHTDNRITKNMPKGVIILERKFLKDITGKVFLLERSPYTVVEVSNVVT